MSHPTRPSAIQLSLRTRAHNPDHHLWDNNGTWWCHFTVHTADGQKRRVRRSLRTPQLDVARRKRDVVLTRLAILSV